MGSNYLASFSLSQVGTFITSLVFITALGCSLYYNHMNEEKANLRNQEIQSDYRRLKINFEDLQKENAKYKAQLNDANIALSNMLAKSESILSNKISVIKTFYSNELDIAKYELKKISEEKIVLSNNAVEVIQKLKNRLAYSDYVNSTSQTVQSNTRQHKNIQTAKPAAVVEKSSSCATCSGTGYVRGKDIVRNINGHITTRPGSQVKCRACNGTGISGNHAGKIR